MRILYFLSPSEAATRIAAIAATFGLEPHLVNVDCYVSISAALDDSATEDVLGFIFDCASLCRHPRVFDDSALAVRLREITAAILLLVSSDSDSMFRLVKLCTRGTVLSIQYTRTASRVDFPKTSKNLTREISGHSFNRAPSGTFILTLSDKARSGIAMEVDENPTFVQLPFDNLNVFVWSTSTVFDVNRLLNSELEFEQSADTYVPAIAFLRHAYGDRCFHSPNARAGLIIDDPLLKRAYGFINFGTLLASARANAYRVTLAFIPWNQWRTKTADLRLFLDHKDCFSLCVHGCDHTNKEFGDTDYGTLFAKNYLAIERMERLRERLGVDYERLFVCPQEQCSVEAWRAFAESGMFLAMINTSCMPRNLSEPSISGADLLTPAQDCFFGFPVLKRHYWKDMSAFAMALFLGKPAILVEHHAFFRSGASTVEHFAAELRRMNQSILWEPLLHTVITTHWRKSNLNGGTSIRFFSNIFEFYHDCRDAHRYQLRKRVNGSTSIRRVLVNGREHPFVIDGIFLALEIEAERPQRFRVEIEKMAVAIVERRTFTWRYRVGVLARRGLSEFRDNVIARNSFALKTGQALMRSFRLTGSVRVEDARNARK